MSEEYPVILDGKNVGKLSISTAGGKTVFDAFCPGMTRLIRLSVYGCGREGYLGVMQPENGGMRLRKLMSTKELTGFPQQIDHAGCQNEVLTSQQSDQATQKKEYETIWRQDVLGLLWTNERGEVLCAIPRHMGIAHMGTELPPRVIEGTEYRTVRTGRT